MSLAAGVSSVTGEVCAHDETRRSAQYMRICRLFVCALVNESAAARLIAG